jgi:hypothetical protein
MKKATRIGFIAVLAVVGIGVAVLLSFREELAHRAYRSSVEFAERQVLENLPEGETIDGVRKEFDALLQLLEENVLSVDDLAPLLDDFAHSFGDQHLSKEEVKRILRDLRALLKR